MGHIRQSIAWWCFAHKDMTAERLVRMAADIGYEAVELVEQEHWQLIKDHGLAIASLRGQQLIEEGFNRREHHGYFAHYHTAGNPGRHELDQTQELQYEPIIQAIAAAGYNGYIGQEFIPTGDPEASLRQAFELCNIHTS